MRIKKEGAKESGWFKINHDLIREDKVIRQVGVNGWAVFCVLRSFINHESKLAFPSYKKIQDLTGLGRNTISNAIKVLEEYGMVVKESKGSKGNSNNKYDLKERTSTKYVLETSKVRMMTRKKAAKKDDVEQLGIKAETVIPPLTISVSASEPSELSVNNECNETLTELQVIHNSILNDMGVYDKLRDFDTFKMKIEELLDSAGSRGIQWAVDYLTYR